jgi:hypothetical protein
MLAAHQSIAAFLLFSFTGALAGAQPPGGRIEYNRDIRPIITENCFACHGPDKNQRKGKLRLDVREVAVERQAIVPGKPAESKLIEHIFSEDPDEVMPPPKSRKVLTAEQKSLLKQWIAAGAEYEMHWAYMPLKRPVVPQTKNQGWVRNPIDAFILSTLESKQIQPSKEAPRSELLRRLSLDLIGLPPSPRELAEFLNDPSPAAYERQVDRLLRSPHYGERMAVPWLDVVRYADTVGYHGDQNQNIFPYRDYVIGAFNSNKPFDQFTVEQLAGDLLPAPTVEQQIASGFNRLNMVTREGGAQPKEYIAKYAADRVRTVSMAWLGSTMGCAECHDHKYDPFTSKDFYQMEAFFSDIQQWGVYAYYDYTPTPELKGVDNDHPFPPEIEVDNPYLHRRIGKLKQLLAQELDKVSATLSTNSEAQLSFEAWRLSALKFLKQHPDGWVNPTPQVVLAMQDTNTVPETNFVIRADGSVQLSELPREKTDLRLSGLDLWVNAIRITVVPQAEVKDVTGNATRFKSSSLTLAATLKGPGTNEDQKLSFSFAEADHKFERYSGSHLVIGIRDRWQLSPYDEHQTGVWILDKPVHLEPGTTLKLKLGGFAVASLRLELSPFGASEPLQAGGSALLTKALRSRSAPTDPHGRLAVESYVQSTSSAPEALQRMRSLDAEIRQCRGGRAFTMVTVAHEPALIRVLRRGNWQDEGGDIVQPLVPHFLPQVSNPSNRRLNRLDLARWLVSPTNPLTSRAVMNRLWKQFFGTGISAVVDDLGAQGEWPVHPKLLDWLASEFIQPSATINPADAAFPWDMKHMVKLMVMSATYRQDSNGREDLKEIDPNNRLVASQSPRRLEAEFVRDNALAISGLLNPDLGGPSVFPYQPSGYYAYLQFPDRDYYANKDDRQYRRGVYSHWQRAFLHPMLANFDAPSREECTANRIVSDTPQQALTLLNDPEFVEASRVFATHLLSHDARTDQARLDLAFMRALAREPKPPEAASLLKFLATQREHYRADQEEAGKFIHIGNAPQPSGIQVSELASWTQVCRVILNLHETITRY